MEMFEVLKIMNDSLNNCYSIFILKMLKEYGADTRLIFFPLTVTVDSTGAIFAG